MTTTVPDAPAVAPARGGPVPRDDAARNVRLVAVAFGVTVVVTRLYLALTGYPQIGGGEYHLAHALWGGLLLMLGGLTALVWSNRWVPTATAVLVGVGSGLFVDEVGKFITARNDYFTPLAAPIIYAVLLGVLGIAVLARRSRLDRPRALAFSVAVRSRYLADGPLRPDDRAALLADLDALEDDTARPDLVAYAHALRPVIAAAPVAEPDDRTRPLVAALRRAEATLLPRWLHRIVLVAGALALGLVSLVGLVVLLALYSNDPDVSIVLDDQVVPPGSRPAMLVLASAGEAVVGLLLVVAAVALLLARDRAGVRLCRVGLIVALAGVNVALGYLDAELVVVAVVLELALLVVADRYRTRFLAGRAVSPPGAGGPPPRRAPGAASS